MQREIGILGLLVKEFDGVPHFLMRAKLEPGNSGAVRLSPTVRATRSNYTGVHRGRVIPYLEHFVAPSTGTVLVDTLQSEHGSWFLRKEHRTTSSRRRQRAMPTPMAWAAGRRGPWKRTWT